MKKATDLLKTVGSWVFVAFCLILALGSGGGAGSILMVIVAIVSLPIKPLQTLWNKLLGVKPEIETDVIEPEAKWWERKKKKEQKQRKAEREDQKKRRISKPLIIACVFFISFCLCMAQVEPASDTNDPVLDNPVQTEESVESSTPADETYSTDSTGESTVVEETITGDETEITEDPSEETTTEPDVTESPETTEPEQLPADSTFSIHYIDVGQADAALVECDGHYMLIDGGNKGDSSVIYSVLKSTSVSKLDIVVGTHAHEDHIGGIPGAYNYTTADLTLCPVTSYDSEAFEDFKTYADKNGGGITIPSVGDTYSLGSATVEILGVNGGSDPNNTSIVLMITYGSTSFLFTGDAEREAEQAILNRGADLSATVLKVGHHGSDTSTTYPFLREIMPQYAIISVGEGNSYGHPTDDNLSRLRDADVTVYRTDLNGDIFLTSDGQTVSITSDKNVSQEEIMTPGSTYVAPPVVTEPDPEPEESTPTGTDYIVNTNTGKFHYPSCGSVKKMKESNKMYYTGTRDELIAKGYDPCGNCHP